MTKDNESQDQGLPAVHDQANQTLQNAPEGVEGTVEVNLRDVDDEAEGEPDVPVGKGHYEAIVVEGVQQGYKFVED